jgi:SAM-dependent methyltransferase
MNDAPDLALVIWHRLPDGTLSAYRLCMSDAVSSAPPVTAADARTPPAGGQASDLASDIEAYYREIAPFYDAELGDRDDLAFWRTLTARRPGCRVLELGAGSGAVTAALAPAAGLVVGVDLSDELLQLARRRLGCWPHAQLVRADMRALPFAVSSAGLFDLIVAPNDPFSHLTDSVDRDRVLQAVAGLLTPSGHFVLDALWLPPPDAAAVRSPRGRVQEHDTTLKGEPLRVHERWRRDPGHRRCCEARYEYRRPGRRPVVARFQARDWSLDELTERFARAGLAETTRWGRYQHDPWHERGSGQLIVAATRST